MNSKDLRPLLGGLLVALDFDGTLAPIVARPEDSRLAAGGLRLLTRLAGRVAQLAVITGRPADTVLALGELDSVPGLVVAGHYGLQRWRGGELSSPPPAAGVSAVRPLLPALLPPGARLEDKQHSLVVHTRGCPDPAAVHAQLAAPLAQLAAAHQLEAVGGRYVWELRPPGTDKGGALRELLAERQPAAVLVAGDDLGDLPMFAAARAFGRPNVCLAVVSADAPPAVAAAADATVDGPEGLLGALEELLDG